MARQSSLEMRRRQVCGVTGFHTRGWWSDRARVARDAAWIPATLGLPTRTNLRPLKLVINAMQVVLSFVLAAGAVAQQWQWQQLPATVHPPASGRVAMAYDPIRDRTVCVADEIVTATPWFTDRRETTWEWDGTRWLARTDVTTPESGSRRTALAFDANRRGVVASTGAGEAWLFDGRDWVQLPLGGGGSSLTFDTARGVLVSLYQFTLYEEQNGQWVPRASLQPFVWDDAELAFDPVSGTVIVFGGWNGTADNATTLRWNGTTLAPVPTTTTTPGRSEHLLAFDPTAGRLLLVGGSTYFTPVGVGDLVHAWTGSDWVVQPSLPVARKRTAGAPHGAVLQLFGGDISAGTAGVTYSPELLQRTPGSAWSTLPLLSAGAFAAHDVARARTVSVDGTRTLEFDGYVWSDTGIPFAGGTAAALAWHSASSRIVAFTTAGGTWSFDGSAWTQAQPPASPPARVGPGLAEDLARGVVVLVGGVGRSDVWEWNGATWSTAPVAPFSGACVMAWDGQRLVTVTPTGGTGPVLTHAYDGALWTPLAPAPQPTVNHRLAGHPTLGVVLVSANYPIYSSGDGAAHLVGGTWQALGVLDAIAGWGPLVFDTNLGALVAHDMALDRDYVLTTAPATAARYGAPCGSPTNVPRLIAPVLPQVGAVARLDVIRAIGNSAAFMFVDAAAASVPLGGGCTLLVANPLLLAGAPTNAGGFASFVVAVPGATALLGVNLSAQALTLDPAGPFFGFGSLTNGVQLQLGH